jgi:hypothetical protein
MARILWAQLCELAFLDNCDRLCMIGIMSRFPVPSLPIIMRQLMIVARVDDVLPGETVGISVAMTAPNGLSSSPCHEESFEVSAAAEYLFITIRDIPLAEEGLHRFEVLVGGETCLSLEAPVRLVSELVREDSHRSGPSPDVFGRASQTSRRDVN